MKIALGPWTLAIETSGVPIVGEAFASAFAPLRLLNDAAVADMTIRLAAETNDVPPPFTLPPDAEAIRWGSFRIFRAGDGTYLDFHETALFRIREADGEGILYYDPRQDATLWIENILLRVLVILLRPRGATLFHASGWADDRGAVLFTGPNGSGKSTLALATAPPGGFLGDDLVVWDGERVWPFPKPPRVAAFSARALGLPAPPEGREKREIPAPLHSPGPHTVRAVWFPEILPAGSRARGEKTRAAEISEGEVLRRIAAGCDHSGRDGAFGPVATDALARSARGRILLGEDVSDWRGVIS